ncbi:MAG: hypothetical protein B9S26_01420 [Opitutia bacterium Tous-C4FEB]|nr:MAG: hypothetical protein B9S35_03085 [Opitutae bacterium Tous-C5TDCM]PAW91341.1 MAG: hypothetical protein B9S26_01420 [Opitutae bacterium Tous-C4FEB]
MGNLTTTFLTSDSDFTTGMGTAVNLGGNFYGFNYAPTPEAADLRALRSDWAIVGQDVANALIQVDADSLCLTDKK